MSSEQQRELTPAERWTNKALFSLVWPLIVEQALVISIGLVDTMTVSVAGEAAVSGISLVDSINVLLIQAFTALATGGAVVVSMYIGRRDDNNASLAAKQLIYIITALAIGFSVMCVLLRVPILHLIYGQVDAAVMANAETYFMLSALGYPFLALYNAGAAIFRSMGNSRISMLASLVVNVIHLAGNLTLINGFGWGVAGAGVSTLVSRIISAGMLLVLLLRLKTGPINVRDLLHVRLRPHMIKGILKIGVPNGLENSMFQIGRLVVARLISTFGTSSIAGNGVAYVVSNFCILPGIGIGFAMLTVVGQCIGAGDLETAKVNVRKLMKAAYATMAVFNVVIMLCSRFIMRAFNLGPAAFDIAVYCILIFAGAAIFVWVPAFALPNALRATGDAKYTMIVSMFSMWTFRVGLSYVFSSAFGWGVYSVWVAMVVDWIVRAFFYWRRWASGKWEAKQII